MNDHFVFILLVLTWFLELSLSQTDQSFYQKNEVLEGHLLFSTLKKILKTYLYNLLTFVYFNLLNLLSFGVLY